MSFLIAVVEDTPSDLERLRSCIYEYALKNQVKIELVSFSSGVDFLSQYRPIFDAVFLDIGLPTINGMDIATQLRESDKITPLVFITNMGQYAVKGYEVDACDFVLKPVEYSAFSLKFKRLLARLETTQDTTILVTVADDVHRLSSKKITYVESSGHKVIYHTTEGSLVAYGSLKKVEEQLSSKQFARCNNCYLVNLLYVHNVSAFTVTVHGTELQISRPKKKAFLQAINNYFGGGV